MPVFAKDILDAGPSGLGLLTSAMGVGAVCGIISAGFMGDFARKGLLLIGGATAYGATLILFGYSTIFLVSIGVLFLMGCCLQVYTITLQTTLQLRVPDELRGRVMGIYGITHNIGPLGALQAGLIAGAFGAPAALAVAGIAIIAFALGVAALKTDIRDLSTPKEAVLAGSS
jgi:sugar phosphate permease